MQADTLPVLIGSRSRIQKILKRVGLQDQPGNGLSSQCFEYAGNEIAVARVDEATTSAAFPILVAVDADLPHALQCFYRRIADGFGKIEAVTKGCSDLR